MSILIELRRIFFAMDLRLKPSRSTPQRLPDYSTVLELKGVYFRIKALTARGDALIRTARDVPLLQHHADELKDRLRSDVYLPLVEVANNVQRFVDVVPGWTPPALAELPERLERARAEFANIQREVRASPSLVIHRTDLNLHDSVISIRDAARGLRFNSTGKLRHKADEIVTIANRFFE